ncbi:MAG: gliding motility protein GldM [Muribaculaceae bacterium]
MASAHNQTIGRMSPRQKMINLMYIVLTAMLALNVSSDVLNGFSQVEDGLARSNRTLTLRNAALVEQLQAFCDKNPEKGTVWLNKAKEVHRATDDLYQYIDSLKYAIAVEADGKNADVKNIENKENIDAAAHVMLPPTGSKGAELKNAVDRYRTFVVSFLTDEAKIKGVNAALSTASRTKTGIASGKKWEESMFEDMPVVAAVTLLSKLQGDIRFAEGEVLQTLITNVDLGDVRVNKLSAFVVPNSRIVMRGSSYSADIVLAAVDTTSLPKVYINGQLLGNGKGKYEVATGKSGNFNYSGYIEVPAGDGSLSRYPFESSYTVIDPMATISATMMTVLYAGINNPISIAVPGVPSSAITATMTNGTLTRNGDQWIARPGKVGTEAVITVTATMDGRQQKVGSTSFRVRKLPDPMPYIAYNDANGSEIRYKGGKPFSKTLLLQAEGISAAIDDDMLNVAYRVLSFETVFFDSMGNAIPEVSNGNKFSQRQIDSFRRLNRGKRFYISKVKAIGPDGIERQLAPMEVLVN